MRPQVNKACGLMSFKADDFSIVPTRFADSSELKAMKKSNKCLLMLVLFGLMMGFSSFAVALEEADVEKEFVTFQHEWMQKLLRNGKYGRSNVQVKVDETQQGVYVASYSELSDPIDYRIKKTDQQGSPYVGVVKYKKIMYSSKGKTPEEATRGDFVCDRELIVTEIFRFSGGKWVY